MKGQVIGKKMPHGYAGSYSRQPDMVVDTVSLAGVSYDYMNQNQGTYRPGDAVPVMKRGCVNVICQAGTPAPGGKVYVRIKANAAKPNAVVGGFEAASDEGNTVELTNAQWKGAADANGVAELRILTVLNA